MVIAAAMFSHGIVLVSSLHRIFKTSRHYEAHLGDPDCYFAPSRSYSASSPKRFCYVGTLPAAECLSTDTMRHFDGSP